MLIYISRRLLWTPVLLFFAGLFIFWLGSVAPGDPAELMAGQRADPEAVERIRERLGLNDPFMVRYIRYISDALKGDFGESYRYRGRDVFELLGPKLRVSLELNLVSYVVTLVIGVPLGFWAAMRQGTWKDPDRDDVHVACIRVAGVLHSTVFDLGLCIVVGLDPCFGLVGHILNASDSSGMHDRSSERVRLYAIHAGIYA